MTPDGSSASSEPVVERKLASHVRSVRIALLLIGILDAWLAYRSYDHLRPWRDGTMFASEPTGEIKRLIDVAYAIAVVTGIASVASVVLAAIAGKRTTFAIYAAIGIFAVHTALRLYQTNGRYLATWPWWVTAVVLGIGFQAASKTKQMRQLRAVPNARVVG